MSYSGWTNYETWNLALWISNEEGSHDYWREQTQICIEQAEADHSPGPITPDEEAAHSLADQLKAETEENMPDVGNSFYGDILTTAIGEVNYDEIATHWVEDQIEEEAA